MPQASPSGLTVRVINNITKKLDVKQRFLETFKNEGYPAQFQYKQKVCTPTAHGLECPACIPICSGLTFFSLDVARQWDCAGRNCSSVGTRSFF